MLDAADPVGTARLFKRPIQDDLWRDLAAAVLPPAWWDVLCPADGATIDLIVVPDGPMASLSLGALPVRDGKLLIEYASVALTPALTLLQARPEPPAHEPEGQRVAVVHLDDPRILPGTAREAQHWRRAAQRMRVIETASQHEVESALLRSLPDIVAISVHGDTGEGDASVQTYGTALRFRDGSVMSAAAALRLRWPPVVILGACWISAVSIRVGREPFGFPLACLMRGATTVVGGIAPIPDRASASILSHVVDSLPDTSVLSALREGQCAKLRGPRRAALSPGELCGLTAWTTEPAQPEQLAFPLHWDKGGLPRTKAKVVATFVPDPPLGEVTRRVLTEAERLAAGHAVGTLDFIAATFAADIADWPGLAAACGIRPRSAADQAGEIATGTVAVDLGQVAVTVTTALARALRYGQEVAVNLNHQVMLPAHVILTSISDDATAAHGWLDGHKHPAPSNWIALLGNRLLGADLSSPDLILWQREALLADPGHQERLTTATLSEPIVVKGSRKWLARAAVVVILLLLPGTVSLGRAAQNLTAGRGALGLVLGASSRPGALILTVLPGSPASRAGLRVGDVITGLGGTAVRTADSAILAVQAHPPGASVRVTIVRHGHARTVPATLSLPSLVTDPGYCGVTFRGSPPKGARIASVLPGSPAAAAGLRPGDVITKVSGTPDGGSSIRRRGAHRASSSRPGDTPHHPAQRPEGPRQRDSEHPAIVRAGPLAYSEAASENSGGTSWPYLPWRPHHQWQPIGGGGTASEIAHETADRHVGTERTPGTLPETAVPCRPGTAHPRHLNPISQRGHRCGYPSCSGHSWTIPGRKVWTYRQPWQIRLMADSANRPPAM